MKPINKYLVIDPIDEQFVSSSGLILSTEDAKSFRYKKATVVESGTQIDTIHKGDVIYYDKNAGHSMMIGDVTTLSFLRGTLLLSYRLVNFFDVVTVYYVCIGGALFEHRVGGLCFCELLPVEFIVYGIEHSSSFV